MDIAELLAFCVRNQASDLHLSAGLPPMLRVHGDMRRINLPAISPPHMQQLLAGVMNESQRQTFATELQCDFAFSVPELARFRVNAFQQQRGAAAVLRHIPDRVPTLEQLKAPAICGELALRARGLVLITGPTGSGKSSTLAAMVQHANEQRQAHILSIEDPIEYIHQSKKCLISQREIGLHAPSFNAALRAALREDPDILLVGELRDAETIQLALTAAETGHLVFATLHTSSAAKTIDRMIDVFEAGARDKVRAMLSESLLAVISQTLLKTRDGNGRIAAHEIMLSSAAIRNLIREGKTPQMYSAIQTSGSAGMQTLEASLSVLAQSSAISYETARAAARSPEYFPLETPAQNQATAGARQQARPGRPV
jgi:twitching motility protein PilT